MHKKLPLVKGGDSIRAPRMNDLIRVVNELSQVGSTTKNGSRRRAYLQPFGVNLFETAGSDPVTYYVTVNDGRVCELNRTAGEDTQAITLHECNNRLTAGDPTKFAIDINEVIYVVVEEDANGAVSLGDVALTVDADDKKSLNYIPTVQGGIYYYKLAKLITTDGVPRLKPFLSGSNIYHETGLNADYRVMSCPDPVDPELYPQTQHSRLRFCSGRLAGIDEDVAIVPLSDNVTEFNVEVCT